MTSTEKSIAHFEPCCTANFIWEIQHLGFVQQIEDNVLLVSPSFGSPDHPAIKLRLELCHSGVKEGEDQQEIKLLLVSMDTFDLGCHIDFNLITEEHLPVFSENGKTIFTELGQFWKSDTFNANDFIDNGKIIVHVEVKAMEVVNTIIGDKEDIPTMHASSLCEDMRRLLDNAVNSGDLELSVGGNGTNVHEMILKARSPVLAEMLNGRTEEDKENGVLVIPDVDYNVMQIVVLYIYTDKVKNIEAIAGQLYPVACNLGLLGLRSMCETSFEMSLSIENATRTLIVVSQHSSDLKARVIDFIRNHGKEVMATEDFKAMASEHPQLCVDVCCAIQGVVL